MVRIMFIYLNNSHKHSVSGIIAAKFNIGIAGTWFHGPVLP